MDEMLVVMELAIEGNDLRGWKIYSSIKSGCILVVTCDEGYRALEIKLIR